MRYPGFLRTFGSRLGAGLADELLDRWFPPPPSFLQRFAEALVDQAPAIVALVDHYTKKSAPQGDGYVPSPPAVPLSPDEILRGQKIADDYVRGAAWAPGCGPLGEFTCPKCGGHTWNTMGPLTSPVVERYCTNGLLTQYPEHNPNTVKTPCTFRWLSTEDHLYFAKPSAEESKRATETQVCVPPEPRHKVRWSPGDQTCDSPGGCASPRAVHLADWDRGVDWGRPVLGVTAGAVEDVYASLVKAIGDRFANADESLGHAAARLIAEADAFIKKQSDKIADLMLDNVFPAGKGEVGIMLTEEMAKKIGVRYAEGAPPIRVSLVLDGWQWAVRLGPGRVGGQLIPLHWTHAEELMRAAANHDIAADQTAIAQNAAGGVA